MVRKGRMKRVGLLAIVFAGAVATGMALIIMTKYAEGITCRDLASGLSTPCSHEGPRQSGLPGLQVVRELQTPGPVSSVLWSSDGTKLAASSLGAGADLPFVFGAHIPSPFGSLITIWNADGQVFRKLERPKPFFGAVDTFAFVAGDKQIVAPPSMQSNDLGFSVFDIDTGEILREIAGSYPGKPRNVNAATVVAASHDQSLLALTFGRALPQPVALYSTRDWSKIADLPEGPTNAAQRPKVVAFSKDNKFLAVGRVDDMALIYDLVNRHVIQRINVFPDRAGSGNSIAIHPEGSMIAVSSGDRAQNSKLPNGRVEIVTPRDLVRVFSIKDGSRLATYPEPSDGACCVTWSPDGRFLAFITAYRLLHLWDPFGSREVTVELSPRSSSLALAFSPDGNLLAVGVGSNVRMYSITP